MDEKNADFVELIASRTCQLLLQKIDNKLESLKPTVTENEVLLTRDETYKFLQVDSSTLWRWTREGKIKFYGIGSRRYYKKSELLKSLIELKS
jgi:regulator of protease activity HflC (stomatin/prohibitin superfamily)